MVAATKMPLKEQMLHAYKVMATQELADLTGLSYKQVEEMIEQQALKLMAVHAANFKE